jgi:YgiT-type zinc finger domain-containing protein
MLEDHRPVCPRCQIGLMQKRLIPYSAIENGQFVNVARMPARVCDVCGNRTYDREPLAALKRMLGASRRKTKPAVAAKKPASTPKTATPRKPKAKPKP